MQDEPVHCAAGDRKCRDTAPDAVIDATGQALLRAENLDTGNGRVYQITFQADDGQGGRCTGQVTVCVPLDKRHPTCIDDGQLYDSTQR
jgi:hypothetical protein